MAELRATPQSPVLGTIANFLRQASAPQRSQQMRGVAEFLGLPGAAREIENWSYGNYPMRINPNAGRTASYIPEVKPGRKQDLADTLLLGADVVAPVVAPARRAVGTLARASEQFAERAVPQVMERGGTGAEMLAALTQGSTSNVVKPKGGNWLSGSIESALQPLRTKVVGAVNEDPADRLKRIEDYLADYKEFNIPFDPTPLEQERVRLAPDVAINRWLDTKLNKYIRNEMGTPEDPVRELAERGIVHQEQSPLSTYNLDAIEEARVKAGFPAEGMATTQAGREWEAAADAALQSSPAETYQNFGSSNLGLDWVNKLDPQTPFYRVDSRGPSNMFDHLIDELKFSMDPNSGLPDNLRFDPKDIDKLTVPQAVERVSKINAWRAEQAAQAEKAGMMENLQATPRMADDSFQLSFVGKPGGAWVDIPETVDEKGMKLCTSIGKAGGWCTQADWAATSYGSGENRLTALVDTEGRPHAQAKITENDWPVSGEGFTRLDPQTKAQYGQYVREWRQRNPEIEELTDEDVIQALKEAGVQGPAPDITELKPVGNSFSSERAQEYAKRDPDYFRKVENSVLKFLNNGNWGKVADLHHYGIVDLKEPNSLVDAMKTLYGDESSRRVGQEFVDAFNYAVETTPDAPRFMTQRQLRDFIGPVEDLEGYAGGGLVKSIGKLVQKYLAKEAPEAVAEAAPKEQKMLMGVYRGYAGEPGGEEALFASPQRSIADYYARRRAAETGATPHAEMLMVDPFAGNQYGLSIPLDKYNRDINFTRARKLKPEDVKDRTPLYAEGGAVNYDPDEIAQIAERATQGFAAGGLVDYDPNEIGTIVSQLKEEFNV